MNLLDHLGDYVRPTRRVPTYGQRGSRRHQSGSECSVACWQYGARAACFSKEALKRQWMRWLRALLEGRTEKKGAVTTPFLSGVVAAASAEKGYDGRSK